ncbi:MFS transporter [Sulfurospirillum diekertiae]|uniref:MFS transporter n=1 Tax=Sulfurospirillum diekertiae TaxID=1854492 RepID=A0A6G9VVU8_9BACT|nr:MFS transporter [Sulfurospirillum diekertiae]QIR77063.1 MFS transporter [Sulfurospirillum diekertiae]QIR79676.1 MFS transporter [Sulfurospirillum diekertiae]
MNINTFRAFQSRNYRLFFSGQSISLMGTWMQRTAVYWVIYMQTNSAFILGLSVFASQFPSFLFSLLGGTIADRYDRFKVLLLTQIASMVQAIAMTLVVVFTDYSVVELIVLSVLLGIVNAFDVPARQSLVHYMVERKEDVGNAIALNSTMVNLARLIGPAVAGFILETFGAGICFMLNALSFIAVIVSLLAMKLPAYIPQAHTQKIFADLKDGLHYLKSTPSLGVLVLLLSLMSLLVLPYTTLFPIIAKETLGGDATIYGYLNSFVGVGALSGAILLASLRTNNNLRKLLIIATTLFGLGILFFALSHTLSFSFLFCTLAGFGMMLHVTIINTLLQTTSSSEMRGRVISYFAMAFFGMQPLGALLIGTISHYIGAEETLILEGCSALLIIALFLPYLWRSIQNAKRS